MDCRTCSHASRCVGHLRQGRDCALSTAASRAALLPLVNLVLWPVRFLRLLPARVDLEWLRWAERSMPALHPDKPHVVRRIRELEERCGR